MARCRRPPGRSHDPDWRRGRRVRPPRFRSLVRAWHRKLPRRARTGSPATAGQARRARSRARSRAPPRRSRARQARNLRAGHRGRGDPPELRQGVEPRKGGATNAIRDSANTSAPNTTRLTPWRSSDCRRGREKRSTLRIRAIRAPTNRSPELPGSSRRQLCGSQTVRRPTTSSRESSIVTSSNTWVTPPVGNGSAGTAISTMKTTAKPFSPNRSIRLPRVLARSCSNQRCS